MQQSGHIGQQNQPHTECKASPYSHPLGFKDVFLTVHGLPLKGPDLFSIYCQLAHSSWKKSPLFLEGGAHSRYTKYSAAVNMCFLGFGRFLFVSFVFLS